MIDCDKAQELLNDYLDESLDPELKTELEKHLEEHPECKELFDQSKFIKKSFSDLTPVTVSNNFDATLREKIVTANIQNQKSGFVRKHRKVSFAFSATALASVLFALVFFDFDDPGQSQEGQIRQSSPVSSSVGKNINQQDAENNAGVTGEDSLKQGVNSYNPQDLKLTGDGDDE